MAENVLAKDFMIRTFRRIAPDRPLGEAVDLLRDSVAEEDGARVVAVIDGDGSFLGILTPRSVLGALVRDWRPESGSGGDPTRLEAGLLEAVRARLARPSREGILPDVPGFAPADRLLRLMKGMSDRRLEWAPVVEEGRILGIIRLRDVFRVAASIALAPETENERGAAGGGAAGGEETTPGGTAA